MTPRQQEILDAYREHGTLRATAKALGLNQRTVERMIARAAKKLPELHAKKAPPGFALRRVTTLNKLAPDGTATPVMQYVMTKADPIDPDAAVRALRDAIDAANVPAKASAPYPARRADDALTVMPIGDPHFGALSWPAETGQAWDLKIAAQTHRAAIDRLFAKAPLAGTALVVWMGDNAHANDQSNATPASGHRLDTDSRWERMLAVLFAAMIHSVDAALVSHAQVIVRVVKGNHDPEVSAALALGLEAYYRNEPRVHVDRTPTPLFVYEWGKCLLVFAHGHAPQPERIPGILAADYREQVGRTKQTYCYTGHLHSKILREGGGIVFEAVQTLAGRDAYATHAGFRSARGLFIDTYDKRCTVATDRASVNAADLGADK